MPTKTNVGEDKVYLAYTYTSQSIHEGSQGRSSMYKPGGRPLTKIAY